MNPTAIFGRVIALVLADGKLSAGIRWRICGYSQAHETFQLRSIDSGSRSSLAWRDFEDFYESHRIAVCDTDPLPQLIERGKCSQTCSTKRTRL